MGLKCRPHGGSKIRFERPQIFHCLWCQDNVVRHSCQNSERLVIVGKGMAWSRAEDEVRAFIERTKLPFLRSPMGKG